MMSFPTKTMTGLISFAFLAFSAAFAQESSSGPPESAPAASSDKAIPKTPPTADGAEAKAKKIMDDMVKAYASCRSYTDKGQVSITFFRGDAAKTRLLRFTTAFVRKDGHFRFEYSQREEEQGEWGKYIIWGQGAAVRTWWYVLSQVEEKASLKEALANASGMSAGTTIKIPPLILVENAGDCSLTALKDLKYVGKQEIAGVVCDQIRGMHPRGNTVTVSIDEQHRLVREVIEEKQYEEFFAHTATRYTPEVNSRIPLSDLLFDPPGEEQVSIP